MSRPTLGFFNLFILWFGAAVSVAEILTGGLLASLGLERGLWAIVLGHALGTSLLVAAGYLGFREREPSIRSMRLSFGRQGSYLISAANVLQLVGWTAVMVLEGGIAVNELTRAIWGVESLFWAKALLGGLVALWVCFGVRGFKRLNVVAVSLLFALTVVLTWVLLARPLPEAAAGSAGGMGFGLGLELSVIMPLSWFPLIADYTSMARTRTASWLAPFLGYFLGSCWMYGIGLFGALHSGSADPSQMMLAAHLGLVALGVIGLSTVTTTFLDVWSASESSRNVFPGLGRRTGAVAFAAIGTALAMAVDMERYVDFLLILGSVFAPIVAILLLDGFVFGADNRARARDWRALVSLAAGFGFYHWAAGLELPVGTTLATLAFTLVVHIILRWLPVGRAAHGRG